jgi:hypothetical protein
MSEMEVEKTGVVPASKTDNREITNPQSDVCVENEDLITKSAPARLPVRASRS